MRLFHDLQTHLHRIIQWAGSLKKISRITEVGSSLTTVEDDPCSQGDSLKRFKHGKMKLHKEVKTFWVAMSAKSSD